MIFSFMYLILPTTLQLLYLHNKTLDKNDFKSFLKMLLILLDKYCLFVIQLCQRNVQNDAASRTMPKEWMMFFPEIFCQN